MTYSRPVRNLLFIGSNLLLFAYKACDKGSSESDWGCMPSLVEHNSMLRGEEWINLGIALFVFGGGCLLAALTVSRDHSWSSRSELLCKATKPSQNSRERRKLAADGSDSDPSRTPCGNGGPRPGNSTGRVLRPHRRNR